MSMTVDDESKLSSYICIVEWMGVTVGGDRFIRIRLFPGIERDKDVAMLGRIQVLQAVHPVGSIMSAIDVVGIR